MNANELQLQEMVRLETSPRVLSDVQQTALDLYERGFNVIPLKRHEKKPFILKPYFTARLHHCDVTCKHKGQEDITELFKRHNIGVIMGRTSGNLLALDCDSQQSFKQIGQELTARAIPFWAITGSRGGAYLLRILEGEAANQSKSNVKDVQVWGNLHLVVMPPSIHPSGILYQWATPEPRFCLPPRETIPAVSIAVLEWLGVTLARKARRQWQEPELFGLPQWAAVLSYDNRETFGRELSEGERNTRLFALACDMKANGREYHEAETVILDAARRAGLPDDEASVLVKHAYSKDRTIPKVFREEEEKSKNANSKDQEPARKVRIWQRAKDFAGSFDWRGTFGRKANTRRAVYLACVERSRLDGRETWRATIRELAELANMNKDTIPTALQDLVTAKLIQRVKTDERIGVYRFVGLSKFRTLYTTGSCSVRNLDNPKTQAEQDVFGKLGLVAWHVWKYLLDNPSRNAGEIATGTGLPRSSVYSALKRLQSAGLATRAGDGLIYGEPRTDASLQSMSLFWNNGSSKSASRKEAHRIERERHVNRLTRWHISRYS
ncbi:MAG: bifunctional DNA primase/polymerase [Chloroflexi bacterium]|nr:bifunctional DNA primase/polymerase [Chloroflexota bacterium]